MLVAYMYLVFFQVFAIALVWQNMLVIAIASNSMYSAQFCLSVMCWNAQIEIDDQQ